MPFLVRDSLPFLPTPSYPSAVDLLFVRDSLPFLYCGVTTLTQTYPNNTLGEVMFDQSRKSFSSGADMLLLTQKLPIGTPAIS